MEDSVPQPFKAISLDIENR